MKWDVLTWSEKKKNSERIGKKIHDCRARACVCNGSELNTVVETVVVRSKEGKAFRHSQHTSNYLSLEPQVTECGVCTKPAAKDIKLRRFRRTMSFHVRSSTRSDIRRTHTHKKKKKQLKLRNGRSASTQVHPRQGRNSSAKKNAFNLDKCKGEVQLMRAEKK